MAINHLKILKSSVYHTVIPDPKWKISMKRHITVMAWSKNRPAIAFTAGCGVRRCSTSCNPWCFPASSSQHRPHGHRKPPALPVLASSSLSLAAGESVVRTGDQHIAGSQPSFPLLSGTFLAMCDNLHPMHNGNYRLGLIFRNSNTADQVSGMHFRTGTRFHCHDTCSKNALESFGVLKGLKLTPWGKKKKSTPQHKSLWWKLS